MAQTIINDFPYQTTTILTDDALLQASTRWHDWLETRRSVRDFSSQPIDKAVIEQAIMAASTAPSGVHKQPWTFLCGAGS